LQVHAEQELAMAVVVSGNAVPFGTDNTLNKQIAEIWKEMEERIDQLAKMSPGEYYDKNLKSENVLQKLNAVQSGHKKWEKLKNTFNHTLTVIANVGGMIADATSQVRSMIHKRKNARLIHCRCSPRPGNATMPSTLLSMRTRATKAYTTRSMSYLKNVSSL